MKPPEYLFMRWSGRAFFWSLDKVLYWCNLMIMTFATGS
jgi:hypothetical protein